MLALESLYVLSQLFEPIFARGTIQEALLECTMHVPDIYVAFCDRLEVQGDFDQNGQDHTRGHIPYLEQKKN